jgi:hypothetical protein
MLCSSAQEPRNVPGAEREAQGLTVLTLDSSWRDRGTLLRRTWATSPAAAAASNALARIANAHLSLRPATWRGLLAHTASWPQAAQEQFPDRRDLLRAFGYGVASAGTCHG